MCAILRMMDEESRKIERKRMTNGQRGREREREGKRGSRVRHRGREAPLIGRWHGRTLQSPWGYMNPGTALSLSLSLPPSLCFSLFPTLLPTVYPRYDSTPRQNAGASHGPRNDQYELPQLDLVSLSPTRCFSLSSFRIHILLYHPPTRLATLGQSLISRYSVENLDWKISEREERY